MVLEYFTRTARALQTADKSKRKALPFYLATHGGFINLDQHDQVCVLPIDIPRKEINVLERALDIVFLQSWPGLLSLFSFLDLACIFTVDVYCTHISVIELGRHTWSKTRKGILSNISTTEADIQRVLDCLLPTTNFPSEPLNSREWLIFPRSIGVVHEVSLDRKQK